MAKQNKATFLTQQDALLDRTAPYDANALVQRTEDKAVRAQDLTNVVYQVSTVGTIGSPAAAFACDFATNDEYNIDTSGSGSSAFSITLSNLEGNSVGKLNITKKTGDTFVFANGTILPSNGTNGQTGLTTIAFMVVKAGATYKVFPLFEDGAWTQVPQPSVAAFLAVDTSNAFFRRTQKGEIKFKGYIECVQTSAGVPSYVELGILPVNNRASRYFEVNQGSGFDLVFNGFAVAGSITGLTQGNGTTTYWYLDTISFYIE
jgi:hypothetical protein